MSILAAVVIDVQGKVTRENGQVLNRRQRLREDMPVNEKTLLLGDHAIVSLVRSDDKAFIIRDVPRWTFPGNMKGSALPPGAYARIVIAFGGNQDPFPPGILGQISQIADRYTRLQDLVDQHQQNNDLVREAVVRGQIADLASGLGLEEFAAENRARSEEIADIVRGRLGQ